MDGQMIRDLFAHTADAAKLLKVDDTLANEILRSAERIALDAIGKHGQLQEWLEDWDGEAPEQHHRHIAHLYAVYPSSQLAESERTTPPMRLRRTRYDRLTTPVTGETPSVEWLQAGRTVAPAGRSRTAMVNRQMHVSAPVSSRISMPHTCELRPRLNGVARAWM